MSFVRSAALVVLWATQATPSDPKVLPVPAPYRPLTSEQRWNLYARGVFWNPMVLFRGAAAASIAQWRDEPPEWGQGAEGFGQRLGHRFGRLAVQKSCEAAAAAALRHEVRYMPSASAGVWPRASHALTANFVTLDRHGHRTMHASRLGGIVAAELVSRRWMPERYRSAYQTTRGVAIDLGFSSAINLLREFTPELKRLLRRK
jgi:hypothetical protein